LYNDIFKNFFLIPKVCKCILTYIMFQNLIFIFFLPSLLYVMRTIDFQYWQYIYICVCVCVCIWHGFYQLQRTNQYFKVLLSTRASLEVHFDDWSSLTSQLNRVKSNCINITNSKEKRIMLHKFIIAHEVFLYFLIDTYPTKKINIIFRDRKGNS